MRQRLSDKRLLGKQPVVLSFLLWILCGCMYANHANAQAASVDSNIHVYLLVGQSNMAGRGKPDSLSKISNRRIIMLDSMNHWVSATDPVHYDKPKVAGVGPAIAFANAMLQQDSAITIALVPCAWGGSPIRVWEPGAAYFAAHPYDDAISRTRLAMKTGVLKGILWHQGESDNDSLKASQYLQKLLALVNRFRSDLQQPGLPFVAGEIGYFNTVQWINPVLQQLPAALPHTAMISAKGLTDIGDHLHFNTPSARELGRRYAEAMKALQWLPVE